MEKEDVVVCFCLVYSISLAQQNMVRVGEDYRLSGCLLNVDEMSKSKRMLLSDECR